MTKKEFWEMIVDNMTDYECEVICPVKKYHIENKKTIALRFAGRLCRCITSIGAEIGA